MVDMTHDCNHRRTLHKFFWIGSLVDFETVFLTFLDFRGIYIVTDADKLYHFVIQRRVDGNHLALHEECLDDFTRLASDLFSQLSDCDTVGIFNFMNISCPAAVVLGEIAVSVIVPSPAVVFSAAFCCRFALFCHT